MFYEPIPSAIRTIQRAGRTARLMKGKLIILITKKPVTKHFFMLQNQERKMKTAIESIKEDLSKEGPIKTIKTEVQKKLE